MTRRSLMSQQAGGSGNVQALILIAILGLGGAAAVRLLGQAVDERGQCAGEEIRTLGGAGPCGAKGAPAFNGVPDGPRQTEAPAQGCGGSDQNAPPPPQGRTLDQILADPHVQAELQRAWNESNPNAPEVRRGQPGSQKQEQGGWIVLNRDTGELEVIRWPPGTRDGANPSPRPPDNEHQTVVGWFHTHPNTNAEGYSPDASPADINWQNQVARVPGIIMTHDGQRTIPMAGPGGGFGRRPPAPPNGLLPWLLLLAALRPLRRAWSAVMVKVVPLCGEAIMTTRRMSLALGLLLCAVVPAALGCHKERPSEMADTGALSPEEQLRVDKAAEDHLLQKGWQRSEFRIEPHGLNADRTVAVVWAVHSDDERSPKPGGGKSLVLHVDRKSLKVIDELGFQ